MRLVFNRLSYRKAFYLLFISFLLITTAKNAYSQETNFISSESNSLVSELNNQSNKLENLQVKINKLWLTVKSNENVIMKKDMENMHAVDQFIALTALVNNLSSEAANILQHLKSMAKTDKIVQNADTRVNLQKLINNNSLLIDVIENMVLNIEESQEILNRHNANE